MVSHHEATGSGPTTRIIFKFGPGRQARSSRVAEGLEPNKVSREWSLDGFGKRNVTPCGRRALR